MPKITNATVSATREIYGQPTMTFPFFWNKNLKPHDYGLIGQFSPAPFTVETNGEYRLDFQLYAGPKEHHRLQALAHGQIAVMHWWSWIEWMAELLLKSMNAVYQVIPSYFWVIILITIVIKLLFWPLTAMSNRSMKAMQALSPKLTELRAKYKDDPQKMNAEMMKLYRVHKVNPMAGCLPTVVQIPVFIGLYNMLRTSIELRGHGFLWIKDLAQPDTIFYLGDFAVNPLPLIMVSTTIWQMKITPTSGDPAQQKMMMLMPIMFLFFFYGTPSGLVLYWTVQNLFSILQMTLTKPAVAGAGGTASGALSPTPAPPNKPKPKPKVKTK
jgi:YidC/Oxa1 family membrane protein insertase